MSVLRLSKLRSQQCAAPRQADYTDHQRPVGEDRACDKCAIGQGRLGERARTWRDWIPQVSGDIEHGRAIRQTRYAGRYPSPAPATTGQSMEPIPVSAGRDDRSAWWSVVHGRGDRFALASVPRAVAGPTGRGCPRTSRFRGRQAANPDANCEP